MSEFSISYHIRVDESRDATKLLRQAKLSGVSFGPANGWLTFVPYADLAKYRNADGPRFAEDVSRLTCLPVLHYCYVEDHGWTFALARVGHPLVSFGCWWDPKPTVERDQFDPLALAPIVPPDLLEPLLRSFDQQEAAQAQPAYRFAELLGLPAYKWLSPDLAQDHGQDLLNQGGRKLGTKPVGTATRLQVPPSRQLTLPQPYLSAREALNLIVPFMVPFKSPWSLTMLSTYGFCQPDGRGIWQARWRHGDSGTTVQVVLMDDGRLTFRADTTPSNATHLLMQPVHLPEKWVDSTEIAEIITRLPVPNGFAMPRWGSMTLKSFPDRPHVWEILFASDRNSVEPFVSWAVYLDAASGDVMAEHLGQRIDYAIVPVRQRLRGGDWLDVNHAV
jgi:hypothetical protein